MHEFAKLDMNGECVKQMPVLRLTSLRSESLLNRVVLMVFVNGGVAHFVHAVQSWHLFSARALSR